MSSFNIFNPQLSLPMFVWFLLSDFFSPFDVKLKWCPYQWWTLWGRSSNGPYISRASCRVHQKVQKPQSSSPWTWGTAPVLCVWLYQGQLPALGTVSGPLKCTSVVGLWNIIAWDIQTFPPATVLGCQAPFFMDLLTIDLLLSSVHWDSGFWPVNFISKRTAFKQCSATIG